MGKSIKSIKKMEDGGPDNATVEVIGSLHELRINVFIYIMDVNNGEIPTGLYK